MKRVGIKDLARLLSLNPSTVSRALSGHPDVSPETSVRVLAAAREFNYHPNLHARYFRKKNSGLVALVLPELNNFFVPGLMQGVNEVLEQAGYNVIVFLSGDVPEKEKEIVTHCISWVVEGVLFSVSGQSSDIAHFKPILDSGIPLVMLDKVIHTDLFSTVTIDDVFASATATDYLIGLGCTRILGVFGNRGLKITRDRMAGFAQKITSAGLNTELCGTFCIDDIHQTEANISEEVMKYGYDGIFFMSDELLLFGFPSLVKAGLYPDKLKILPVSDGKFIPFVHPPMPHILHNGYETGRLAAEKLVAEITRNDPEIKHLTAETHLVSI